jgi:hypothetical protein
MKIILYQATNDQGRNLHRFALEQKHVGTPKTRNARLEKLKKELLSTWRGDIISSGWTDVTALIEGWGYSVVIEEGGRS